MRRPSFFIVEALRALRNNLATTVAATVTVLIVLYFLGVFVLFGTYLVAKVNKERSGVRVTVYLDQRATSQQVAAIGARLRQNPDVKPNGVKYGGRDADRLLRNAAVVEAVIFGLILVLAISAVALIANTIRLSIFARRREVEVMKLVGASNWFVRLPFVLEGMLCGIGGALLSIGLLGVSLVLLKDHLPAASLNEDGAHAIAFWLLAPLLLFAGTLLGALGSGVTMRRFLRV